MLPSSVVADRPIVLYLTCAEKPAWLAKAAVRDAFDLLVAPDRAEADRLASSCHPDLLLACSPIAREESGPATRPLHRLPLVLLTAPPAGALPPSDVADILPLDPDGIEIAIRLRSVLRRLRPTALTHRVTYAGLELDHRDRRVQVGGREVALSLLEFNLLALLLEAPERTWTYAEVGRAAWGCGPAHSDGALQRVMRSLKAKLGASDGLLIQTVADTGFRMVAERG